MPKKAPQGPFFFFMKEWKQKNKYNGGWQEISEACSPEWKRLSPQQREPYEKMSKANKQQSKLHGERYTAQNIPLSHVENAQREVERMEHAMRKDISQLVRDAVDDNQLQYQEFYFVHFNYFCKTSEAYIPAEFAISKFTLLDGVCETYHTLINPGKLPLGMPGVAKDHSEKIHLLPPPPFAKGEHDYTKILDDIVKFFFHPNAAYPILFTADDDRPMVTDIFDRFCFENKMENNFVIYPITELFYEVKKATAEVGGKEQPLRSIFMAKNVFEQQAFDYREGMGCEYHTNEAAGKYQNCSKTKVVGWCYTFADHCCKDMDIPLIAGKHLPVNVDTSTLFTISTIEFNDHFRQPKPRYNNPASDTMTSASASSFRTAPSEVSKTTRPYQPTTQPQQPPMRPPPGFSSNDRDPRTRQTNNESYCSDLNSTNPFRNELATERANATFAGGSSADFPSLNDSNRFSRSHMAESVRAPINGKGRGILAPFTNNSAWGSRK